MTEQPAPDAGTLRTAATVLAASAIGAPLLVLLLTRAVLFQLDPRGIARVDPAAYEVEMWVAGGIAAAVMAAAIARVFALLGRRDRAALRYPALVVQLQLGITIAALALVLLTPGTL